jgi:transmembrane sensor
MSGGADHPVMQLDAIDREAQHWVTRFAGGDAVAEELATFRLWAARDPAHAQAFARACRLWEAVGPAAKMFADADTRAAFVAAVPAVSRSSPRPQLARRAFIGGALAASAAAVGYVAIRPPLGLWPSVVELAADYRTAVGEQRVIALAGGPSIDLNTRTSIALRPVADGTESIELIAGEAAVTARGAQRRVEVIAIGGRVSAADASFNIRCDGPLVQTTCVAGEIEVAYRAQSVRLGVGQQVSYSDTGIGAASAVDAAAVTAWRDGVLLFHATPLADAVAEINRYRTGRIILTNAALGQRLFNARFRIANIDGVVEQIQRIFDTSVTRLPGGIVLLG